MIRSLPAVLMILGQIVGPRVGFIFDAGTGLRAIRGIPGASSLTDPLTTDPLSFVRFSPRDQYALAVMAGGDLEILRFGDSSNESSRIEGVAGGIEDIVISPNGASAALLYTSSHRIDVLADISGAPRVINSFDTSALPGSPTAVAVADDGSLLFAAFWDGESGSLFALGSEGNRFISQFGRVSAIALARNGRDLLIADQSNNEVVSFQDLTADRIVLAGSKDGVMAPIGIGRRDDGSRIFIANSDNSVLALSSDRPPVRISCECQVSGLYRMKDDSIFRLNEPGDGPVFILDGSMDTPQIFFVPAIQ